MQLSKYPDAAVQQQIAQCALAIDSAVPGYKVRSMALPQGLWPKNRALASHGSWTNPKTGKTTTYNYEVVFEVDKIVLLKRRPPPDQSGQGDRP